ncbi:GbsR/MarR family transcriptional regulator [Streptomyces odontomachi]|uniref:GbsR/MarR family transcriptional regulator n=1 Tax=Streptomyces odontomachi TaxID=2944940 RepID=UPI00210E6226|nr:MarR family transcriptional regulator [Streptomyces sp. ODS25]
MTENTGPQADGSAASGAAPEAVSAAHAQGGEATPPPADPQAVSRFVEAFASQLVEGGMPRMPARVFAGLLASEDGVLTSAELSERLQVSPAAISGAVRYLATAMMVSREREPGSRRERYRVHRDQWYEMLTNREGMLRRWEATLQKGIDTVGPDSRPGQRIAETLEFLLFLHEEFTTVMDRWRKHREQLFGRGGDRP